MSFIVEAEHKKNKILTFFKYFILFFFLFSILIIYARSALIFSIANVVAHYSYSTQNEALSDIWGDMYGSNIYQSYLLDRGVTLEYKESLTIAENVRNQIQEIEERQLPINIVATFVEIEAYEVTLEPEVEEKITTLLPKGVDAVLKADGVDVSGERKSMFKQQVNQIQATILSDELEERSLDKKTIKYVGNGQEEEIKASFIQTLETFLDQKPRDQLSTKEDLFINSEKFYLTLAHKDFKVDDIIFSKSDEGQAVKNGEIGQVSLRIEPCDKVIEIPLVFSEEESLKLSVTEGMRRVYCTVSNTSQGEFVQSDCLICDLYPADKVHALSPTYEPPTIVVNVLDQEVTVHRAIVPDLIRLIMAAKEDGINLTITSAYRSFENQQNTFEFWVSQEMAAGYDPESAENRANTYSAKPGFSEHQLGTTVDLNAKECESFVTFCSYNQVAWDWLKQNAYNYGFVLSYPKDSQAITGYIYEPWHYRWIGKDLASQFIQQDATLNVWLQTRSLK